MDGLDDIPIERLTPQFIQDFSIYLSADKGLRGGTDKPQLSYARDVFVFAAFTGLSYIDLKELRVSDIKDINGATWIVSQRHKSKVAYQVKLLDIPPTDSPSLSEAWGGKSVRQHGISDDGQTHFNDHAGFWDIRTSPPRRFMPRLPCRN